MSFWVLEKSDMHEVAYLFPQILGPSGNRVRWAYILTHFRHSVLAAMLVISTLFGCALTLSSMYIAGTGASLITHSHGAHHVASGALYFCLSAFILFIDIKVAQSCVRLANFLRREHTTPR